MTETTDSRIDFRDWTMTSAFFKGNTDNIGLGRGTALDIFNAGITSFEEIEP